MTDPDLVPPRTSPSTSTDKVHGACLDHSGHERVYGSFHNFIFKFKKIISGKINKVSQLLVSLESPTRA